MALNQRLQSQLQQVRKMGEDLLSVFSAPDQWTYQVHDQANHPLWCIGHLGLVDNFMLSLLAPDRACEKPGYQPMFGMGSQPSSAPSNYPPPDEVLAFMRERRQVLLEVLADLTDENLRQPGPPEFRDFMPDIASCFEATVWHEALHLGQVTIARRALGYPPLVRS